MLDFFVSISISLDDGEGVTNVDAPDEFRGMYLSIRRSIVSKPA